jgi:hypothetical protein
MLAAAQYIGAGLLLNKYIKEMRSITLFSFIYVTAFIIYFLYTHLFDLYLIENNCFTLEAVQLFVQALKDNFNLTLSMSEDPWPMTC